MPSAANVRDDRASGIRFYGIGNEMARVPVARDQPARFASNRVEVIEIDGGFESGSSEEFGKGRVARQALALRIASKTVHPELLTRAPLGCKRTSRTEARSARRAPAAKVRKRQTRADTPRRVLLAFRRASRLPQRLALWHAGGSSKKAAASL